MAVLSALQFRSVVRGLGEKEIPRGYWTQLGVWLNFLLAAVALALAVHFVLAALSMGLYQRYLLPRLVQCACGSPVIDRQRQKVVPQAQGEVLEIGFGSGLNLPHYRREQVAQAVGAGALGRDARAGRAARGRHRAWTCSGSTCPARPCRCPTPASTAW